MFQNIVFGIFRSTSNRAVNMWPSRSPKTELPTQSSSDAQPPLRQYHLLSYRDKNADRQTILFSMAVRGQFVMVINTNY